MRPGQFTTNGSHTPPSHFDALPPLGLRPSIVPSTPRLVLMSQPSDEGVFENGVVRFGVDYYIAYAYGQWHVIAKCTA